MLRVPEGTDLDQARRVFDAFAHLNSTLKAARPDVLVIIGTDHMMTFSYEGVPVFAVGGNDGVARDPLDRIDDDLHVGKVEGRVVDVRNQWTVAAEPPVRVELAARLGILDGGEVL